MEAYMHENNALMMQNIIKEYALGNETFTALKHINLTVARGEFVSILGPSGSGKSTLMNIMGFLDKPTAGRYVFNGNEIEGLDEAELACIRNKEIGFVFQSFHLLPRQTAFENVELPLVYAHVSTNERRRRVEAMLENVGLSDKRNNYPNQLSGGQQQRVAIARAMVTEPTLILADEPTGALDQKTGHQIMDLFMELNATGKTIIVITHDQSIAAYASRVVRILDGEVFEEGGARID
jgi:putative ABC transport system ATP-binding protein